MVDAALVIDVALTRVGLFEGVQDDGVGSHR
jgi:hypothetical protein